MNFERYQHVERLGTPAVDGILNGVCFIFPKLDGFNTSIYLNDSGEVEVASRNCVLSADNDNHGVRHYVHSQPNFKAYLDKFPTHRLFAEWLVPHTIRDYTDDAWRKLYIFDVMRDGRYLNYYEYLLGLMDFNLNFIAPADILSKPTLEQLEILRDNNFYFMKNGNIGEGLVIKNYDFVNQFGETVWAKFVREIPNPTKKSSAILPVDSVEAKIIDSFLYPNLIEKEFVKLDISGWRREYIGQFIKNVWRTFINEELFNALKKFHNPIINFNLLHKLAVKKIKEVAPDIFQRF